MGNQRGEIVISVLTTSEGLDALRPMALGLIQRYESAGQPHPEVLYTDRDCCRVGGGRSRLQDLFQEWGELVVRLDSWHFMNRFCMGVTSTAHPLFGSFMASLAACLFDWDASDVARLTAAKRAALQAQGVSQPTAWAVRHSIDKDALARHCRRRTAGVQTSVDRVETLLLEMADATDTLGTPLLKPEMSDIWAEQRHHLKCLQDPDGVHLYTRTGHLHIGGKRLPVFRCARGTTSLESFHLHLCRFIPGKITEISYGSNHTPVTFASFDFLELCRVMALLTCSCLVFSALDHCDLF